MEGLIKYLFMKKLALLLIISLISVAVTAQSLPNVIAGSIKRHENFYSKFVTARNVDVWLPDGYTAKKKYNVLYMHDGQMLFDSSSTWTHSSWDVDDVISSLLQLGKLQDVIVVGIWNDGKARHADYFPQQPFEALSQAEKDTVYAAARVNGYSVFGEYKIQSNNYLKFLVTELKPFIDSAYSTYKDRKHTFIMGSSMGGLISMYAICEYPNVFGGAACMSTHWPGIFTMKNNPMPEAFTKYMKAHLPNPATHKLYFDYGDQTLDALYPPLQKKVDEIMKTKGYNQYNWLTKFFPGQNHSEIFWHSRVDIPLLFLLKK
jgi:enterochelin esterase-like enzyme